jgi:signal transduction histidine kinase
MNLKDLLDRNLIEKGVLEPVFQPNKLSVLILEVIEIMQYQANSKNQTIMCQIPSAAKVYYMMDAYRFQQILINLLSNAVKFSHHESTIFVEISCEKITSEKRSLKIQVVD